MRTIRSPCCLKWRWTGPCRRDEEASQTRDCCCAARPGFLTAKRTLVRNESQGLGELYMVTGRTAKLVAIGAIVAGTLVAESKKEYHFSVGPEAGVSVMNPYGSISVRPSLNNTV